MQLEKNMKTQKSRKVPRNRQQFKSSKAGWRFGWPKMFCF
jgi:hypothetical protein